MRTTVEIVRDIFKLPNGQKSMLFDKTKVVFLVGGVRLLTINFDEYKQLIKNTR